MLTRMARTGCGSHGSIPLRLHQRKGSLAGADLAGTVRAIWLPAEVGDCRARFPGRAGGRGSTARGSLDRHATYIVAAYVAGAAR